LLLAVGFLLLSKGEEDTSNLILMRNRGQNLGYHEKKKIFLNLDNREGKEKVFFKILKIERRKRNCPTNLENREEKEKLFNKILKIERRKRNCSTKS